MLAVAQPAEAQIIFTPAHVVIKPGSTYHLDLNHDGAADFSFTDFASARFSVASLYVSAFASNQGQSGNAVEVSASDIFLPRALNRGARIGSSGIFYGSCIGCNSSREIMAWIDPYKEAGDWVNVEDRFVGVRLLINHETYYGWARFSVRAVDNKVTALLTGYAYEATPSKPIIAGQTAETADDETSGEAPISQELHPASLGILALGAQGLPLWRDYVDSTR